MRPLEWLLALSFVPVLLLPLIQIAWRRRHPERSRWFAAPLPALASLAQIAAEGWRAQMIPLYGLAALVLAGRLTALRRSGRPWRRGRAIAASAATALTLALGVVLAGWLLPVVRLPDPTGPYRVGVVDRELTDAARGRRLMVSVWYPAAEGGPPAPLFDHADRVTDALADSFGLPAPLLAHLRYVTVAASEGVPILADGAPFPVLVFSHGLVGLRSQNSAMLQELASWGYVVVAIDHTDAAAVTVFPDGEARPFDLGRLGIGADEQEDKTVINDRLLPVWIADQRFVYDTLEAWAAGDPLLRGRLDLTRIGSFGHSFGGATSLDVCQVDARCRAAADLDGALYGASVDKPAARPLMLMSSAESGGYPDTVAEWGRMIASAQAPAYWLELPGSTHLSFTITQLLSPALVPRDFDPRAGLHTADIYLRAFFDRHLRGTSALPLGPASGDPNVRWRSR